MLLQIELLSPQQNGTAVDLEGSTSGGNAQRASIKGMWKKAFRSLKSHSKDKDERPAENKTEDRKHVQRTVSDTWQQSFYLFYASGSTTLIVTVISGFQARIRLSNSPDVL